MSSCKCALKLLSPILLGSCSTTGSIYVYKYKAGTNETPSKEMQMVFEDKTLKNEANLSQTVESQVINPVTLRGGRTSLIKLKES